MIDTGIINMFYFYTIKSKAAVETIRVRLNDMTVDPKILQKAVEKSVDRFYFFGLTPVLDENGCVFFDKNTRPVEVYPDDGTFAYLGTADCNGYLFRVMYTDNTVGLSFFHAITDGRGSIAFLVSVLYHYLTLSGLDISSEGIICDVLPEDGSERDILTDQIPEKLDHEWAQMPGEVFVLPEENVLNKTPYTKKIDLCFPVKELLDKAKEYSATPLPLVSVLCGIAMDGVYDTQDKSIVSSVLVDMHDMQQSRALSNYCCNVFLPLEGDVRRAGIQEAIDDQKRWMEKVNTPANLFGKLAELKKMEPLIRKTPLNDPRYLMAAMKKDDNVGKAKATYFLTNVGKIRFPKDLMKYIDIDECDFNSMNAGSNPIVSLMSIGDKGHIYVTQNFESTAFAESLCKVLNDNGISAVYTDCGQIRADSVDPARFAKAVC